MNMLRVWMRKATEEERVALAAAVGTSRGYLNQLAMDNHREPRPELAAAFEEVTAGFHRASNGRLPRLYRTDLVTACRGCAFAAQCLGQDVIVRADFPVVAFSEQQ